MADKRIRQWYVAYPIGDSNIAFLISAYSIGGVYKWLKRTPRTYIVKLARVWQFASVICKYPIALPQRDELAPNEWDMSLDFVTTRVVILN